MVVKKYTKKRYRWYKRNYARTTRHRALKVPFGLPDKYMCKFKYSDIISLDPANAGVAVSEVFRANSLYDPYNPVGGHQYMYFDQFCLFYTTFQVLSCKITMTPFQSIQTGVNPFVYGITLSDSGTATSGSTLTYILEQEKTTKNIRNAGIVNANVGHGGPKLFTAKCTYSQKKWFGQKGLDDKFQHGSGNDPAETVYFECWGCGKNGDEAGECDFIIQMEALAICMEPKNVAQS